MALKIYDKLKPQGNYPAVDAADVALPNGARLTSVIPVYVTEEQYAALEAAGEIDPDATYFIYG